MQDENPYSAPNSAVADIQPAGLVLADRGMRLVAAFIDGILLAILLVPILIMFGFFSGIASGQSAGIGFGLGIGLSSIAVFLLIQSYPLKTSGQTWAKKWLKMKIVDMDGNQPEFFKLVGLRYLVVQVINMVPVVGGLFGLVDVLFIFSEDRRCIHDRLAGTQVVVAD